jgi:hypothetical protein
MYAPDYGAYLPTRAASLARAVIGAAVAVGLVWKRTDMK